MTTTWTLRDGREASVTVVEVTATSETQFGATVMVPCYRQYLVATVDGVEVGRGESVTTQSGRTDGIVASLGKLGISADNLAKIEASAMTTLRMAHDAAAAAGDLARAECDARHDRIALAMRR